MNKVVINEKITVGSGQPLLLIAGPCQIESLPHCLSICEFLRDLCRKLGISYVFKASFDKANRTSLKGVRGPGLEAGLEILAAVKKELAVPVLTDVHSPEQAEIAAKYVDVLQTPAFLCRQTDLLLAAGKTGKVINVKKGQFLPPGDMLYAQEKIKSTGNERILFCERGTTFGYRDLIVDMRSFQIMRQLGSPVIFDGTHSVQSMGGASGASGGSREFIPSLVRGAAAVGIDGLFLECHDNPQAAPSDGAVMLALDSVSELLETVLKIRAAVALA